MSNTGTVIALAGTATAVNVFSAFNAEKDVARGIGSVSNTLISSAGITLVIVGIGEFLSWDLAKVLAVLHLLGTMLTNGLPILEFLTKLIGGK